MGDKSGVWRTISGRRVFIKARRPENSFGVVRIGDKTFYNSGTGWSTANPFDNYLETRMTIGFAAQLEQIENGTFDKKHSHIVVGNTPKIFLDKAGLPDLPLVMRYDTAYLSMKQLGELKGNYHDLGIETMKELPNALNNPLYIFKSDNQKRVEAIVELTDKKGRNIFVSVEFDTVGRIEGKHKAVNLIITAFGAKEAYIHNRISAGNLIYKKI